MSTITFGKLLGDSRRNLGLSQKEFTQLLQQHSVNLESRFSLNIDVPARRPIINLKNGDILIIAEVSGLPSFTHKYSQAEIDGASIIFVQHKIHTGVVHEAEETTIKEDEYFA
jgi:hypothetical protein